jgi:hypothetical protein
LEERLNNLRTSMAAARNAQDRFALALQAQRVEAELAQLHREPPAEHSGGPEAIAPPFPDTPR